MDTPIIKLSRPIVLATASKARQRLVSNIGIEYLADTVEIDETPKDGELAHEYVVRLAKEKADAVVPPSLDALIIAVDTTISIDDAIIGKPNDEADARAILARLSGRSHDVLSAIAMRDVKEAKVETELTKTAVTFDDLTEDRIEWYISTGEWRGRAGAYAIQEKGMALVKEIGGCLTNVIGMSVPCLLKMLSRLQSSVFRLP